MYSIYAKYYDRLNNNYDFWIPFINNQIVSIPQGSSLIEYGCGTGNVLLRYKDIYRISGVDLSEAMLIQAKKKLPTGTFYSADMVNFRPGQNYDIALCLFDTVNHILTSSDWLIFFKNVAQSLTEQGIFILDANTTERLQGLEKRPAFFNEFDDNYFYMKVRKKGEKNYIFDVRILKKIGEKTYGEEREEIEETTESGKVIYNTLKEVFPVVTVYNEKKELLTEAMFNEQEQSRWFYVCRKSTTLTADGRAWQK